jgi:hypothetical protein
MVVWIVAGAFGLIGVYYFFAGLGGMTRGRFGSGLFSTIFGALTAVGGGAAALLGLDMSAYARLTVEQPVASIAVSQTGQQAYALELRLPDGSTTRYDMLGDEWRIEAIVVKWKPWTNVLGQHAMYKLDRLSGRYRSTDQEVSAPRSVFDLSTSGTELDPYAEKVGSFFYAVDAVYGSGVYLPMVDGARYDVFLTQDALIARPTNDIGSAAANTYLSVAGN